MPEAAYQIAEGICIICSGISYLTTAYIPFPFHSFFHKAVRVYPCPYYKSVSRMPLKGKRYTYTQC